MEKGTTIKEVNGNIINLLTDAGPNGLHEDDVLHLLAFPNKKHLIIRLQDLKGRSEITDLAGGRWKKLNTAADGTSFARRAVNLPGSPKFTSYKNTLNEYCQKKYMPVPNYECCEERHGFIVTVTFASHRVRCDVRCDSKKEAEARAAYEALRKLGYLTDHEFEFRTVFKRKKVCGDDYAETVGKRVKEERVDGIGKIRTGKSTGKSRSGKSRSGKSRLNEYVQKYKLSKPTYVTVATDEGFFSIVTVNGNEYKSVRMGAKRKNFAEQSAVQVALNALNKSTGLPLPDDTTGGNW